MARLIGTCFMSAAALLGQGMAGAEELVAFATSISGPGDMSGWPDVSGTGLSGLDAADATCRARAASANLPKSGQFVAWLSDRDNDAYCRLYGLSGKKASNCGEPALPTGAGPWVRVDRTPFIGSIEEALDSNVVYAQLDVDESGTRFHTRALSWTATDIDGAFNTRLEENGDCDRWASSVQDPFAPFPTLGSNLAAGQDWTFNGSGASCDSQYRLTCLQKGTGTPLSGHSEFGRREAFVSSIDVSTDLGGTAGADALCQTLAANAGLYHPVSFKALIASYEEGVDIADRIAFDGPWYRVDGLLFAHDKAELTGGAVTLPLNVTETGAYLGTAAALTGATRHGIAQAQFDCNGWTDQTGASSASGSLINQVAFADSGGTNWLDVTHTSCTASPPPQYWPRKLYCVSDSDVIFHSEFEAAKRSL